MNKQFLILTLFFSQCILAQDFPGYRTGNYTGVNGVFFNPANIADSRYRWDFNLFTLSTNVGNDKASFSLKNIGKTFNGDSITHQFIGQGAGASSGMVNATINGPSLMFNVGKKASVAITSRARIIMNATDIDGHLANQLMSDANNGNVTFPYTINSNDNMKATVNAWSEFGVSYARVITDKGNHFLKGGITLKYVAGVANAYANVANLHGTLTEDVLAQKVYLTNSTGRMQVGFGGINLDDFDVNKLTSFQSTGLGADIGFVYEFRPGSEKFKLDGNNWRRDLNKYKLRLGVALLDIGSISYQSDVQRSGGYDISITGSKKLDMDEISNTGLDQLKNYFDSRPQFFTPVAGTGSSNYKVSLPTTLHIDADYHFHKGFYLNLAGQLSLVNAKDNPYNSQYYSSFSVTPRYEGRGIGIYVPVNYNALTNFNAGLSLRFKSLFIGSGSVLTALLGNSKQADIYMGIRVGGLQKNKSK